jgi:hypothetical protein
MRQSASGATTFSSMQGRTPGLCEAPRYKAGPHWYTINDATTPRRGRFVAQIAPSPWLGLPATAGATPPKATATTAETTAEAAAAKTTAAEATTPPKGTASHNLPSSP